MSSCIKKVENFDDNGSRRDMMVVKRLRGGFPFRQRLNDLRFPIVSIGRIEKVKGETIYQWIVQSQVLRTTRKIPWEPNAFLVLSQIRKDKFLQINFFTKQPELKFNRY